MKRYILITFMLVIVLAFCGCEYSGSEIDSITTIENADRLQSNQPTPSDLEYSLERYNLIRRAYWVNGMRDKANSLICEVTKPLGYIVLFSDNGSIFGKFTVDGKVSSLNSFLTPDTEYPCLDSYNNDWIADVDGSYGQNDNGIFFFTVDGYYIEWNSNYFYSDLPIEINDPVLKYEEV